MIFSKALSIASLLFFLGLPVVMIALPADYFDNPAVCTGESFTPCALKSAMLHFVHLDFEGAKAYNRYVFLIFPVAFALWAKVVKDNIDELKKP